MPPAMVITRLCPYASCESRGGHTADAQCMLMNHLGFDKRDHACIRVSAFLVFCLAHGKRQLNTYELNGCETEIWFISEPGGKNSLLGKILTVPGSQSFI